MGATDAEGEARAIFARAGYDTSELPGVARLAHELLGPASVLRAGPGILPAGEDAQLMRLRGRAIIRLSSRLSPEQAAFALCHELAHWHLESHHGDETEALCDAIAAALLCPRVAFREAVAEHGMRFDVLAEDFGVSASCAALRYGEVVGAPLALVSPAQVRVRGEPWEWGDERALRALARCGQLPREVQRVWLGAQARVALVAG